MTGFPAGCSQNAPGSKMVPSAIIKRNVATRPASTIRGCSVATADSTDGTNQEKISMTFPTKVPVERTPSSVRAKFAMTLTNGRRRPFYGFGPSRLLSETSSIPEEETTADRLLVGNWALSANGLIGGPHATNPENLRRPQIFSAVKSIDDSAPRTPREPSQ